MSSTWSAGQDAKEVFRGHGFRDLKWAWKSRVQALTQQFLRTLLVECVWKPFLLQKSVSYLITVCALPAEVLRKFYSAVWGWRREVLFNFKQHVRSNCVAEETCVRSLKHQFDKELKVSNLLLDAISNNKAYGKSLAATEHKDTISDEDKQRLGNFALCLRNARFDIVCFGSMAEDTGGALCCFQLTPRRLLQIQLKNMFWTCFGFPVWWILMRFVWTGFMGSTNLQTKFMGNYKPREILWAQMGRAKYKPL